MSLLVRLFCVALGLCLAGGVNAQDSSDAGDFELEDAFPTSSAEILSWRAPIPANGAFVVRSPDGTVPTVEVEGPGGAAVEGELTEYSAELRVWKPSAPFALGEHTVALHHQLSRARDTTFTITIVDAIDRTPPEITSMPTIATLIQTSLTACCTTPLRIDIVDRCVPVLEEALILLQPNLASTEPVARLNQFMFQARLADDSIEASGGWEPFDLATPLRLLEAPETMCVAIEAIDIATEQVHFYPELTRCLPRNETPIGEMDVPLPDALLTDPACLQAPAGYEAKWCELNRPKCAAGEPCELYRYACEGAALPSPWREMAAHPSFRDSNIRVDAVDAGGCSVTQRSTRSAPYESRCAWLAALLLVHVARRRGNARRDADRAQVPAGKSQSSATPAAMR